MTTLRVTEIDELRTIVREERRRRGMSQGWVAGRMGTTQQWLSNFERGLTDPPASMVLRLIVMIGMHPTVEFGILPPIDAAMTPAEDLSL